MRCLPLAPYVAEQCAVTGQVGGGANGSALSSAARLGPGAPERLVSGSLADGQDECVRYGPDQFPVPIVVVGLVCLRGAGFGGHGVPSFTSFT